LSRPTDRVDFLDGWRGTAIFALLVGHFTAGFGLGARFGIDAARLGVELFFVLSGLLMGNLLFVRRMPISDFYKRRVSRIFPALYAYIILQTLFVQLVFHRHNLASVASVFLMYFNYFAATAAMRVPKFHQHIWSLCIEEHSYILLSLIAVTARRWPVKDTLLIGLCILVSWTFAACYTAFTDWGYYGIFFRTEARLGAVFTSALLTCRLRDGHPPLVTGGWWLVPFLLGLASQTRWVPDLLKYTFGTTLLAIAVTHLRFAWPALVRPYRMKWLMLLGVLSYSIYLWQQPFMVFTDQRYISRPVALLGALAMGTLSYYALEHPVREYLNRVWAKPRPATAG